MNSWMRSRPGGARYGSGRAVTCRARVDIRALRNQKLTASVFELAAAHISAVVPRSFSRSSTFAPWARQLLDNRDASGAGRHHQRRLAVVERLVGVGAGLEQKFTTSALPASQASASGVMPVSVRALALAPAARSALVAARVAVISGPMQRRRSVGLGGVHVRAGGDQLADIGCGIAMHRGIGNRIARCPRTRAECTQKQRQSSFDPSEHGRIVVGGGCPRAAMSAMQSSHDAALAPERKPRMPS